MPETAIWFYARNGQQYGPCTLSHLKQLAASGQVGHSDLVWTQGMAEWRPASAINGLFAVTAVRPPAPPKVQGVSTPFPSIATSAKVAQKPNFQKQPIIIVSVIVAVIIVFAIVDDPAKPRNRRPANAQQVPNSRPGQTTHDSTGTSSMAHSGSKLAAFQKVVVMFHQTPGDFASDDERRRFNEELNEVMGAFKAIKFDPKTNRKEAQAIIELYRKDIENRYRGEIPRELDIYLGGMYQELTW